MNGLESPELKAKPIFGFTDPETVMLDLDDKSFRSARYWAFLTMKKFRLGGFIILKSSKNHYHVVFNCKVSWINNLSVIGWVALLSRSTKLKDYLVMQCIKKASTLRVSVKDEKPSPRVVYRYGKQDGAVREFLRYRRIIKRIVKGVK